MPLFMPGRLGWVELPTNKVVVEGGGGMLWFKGCLRRPHGVLYVAGKKHYFGVGGGTRQFKSLVDQQAGEAEGSFGRRLPHSSASKPQGRFTRRSAGCGASVACHEEEGEQRGREWGESDAHHLCQGIQSSKNFCMRVRVAMHRVEKGRGWGEAGKGMGGSRERDGGKQGAGWGEAGSGMGGSREGDGGKQGRGWGEAGMGMGGSREGDGGKQVRQRRIYWGVNGAGGSEGGWEGEREEREKGKRERKGREGEGERDRGMKVESKVGRDGGRGREGRRRDGGRKLGRNEEAGATRRSAHGRRGEARAGEEEKRARATRKSARGRRGKARAGDEQKRARATVQGARAGDEEKRGTVGSAGRWESRATKESERDEWEIS
ncbi:unnamed protein product [Closterium sp. NIES-54]